MITFLVLHPSQQPRKEHFKYCNSLWIQAFIRNKLRLMQYAAAVLFLLAVIRIILFITTPTLLPLSCNKKRENAHIWTVYHTLHHGISIGPTKEEITNYTKYSFFSTSSSVFPIFIFVFLDTKM